MSEFKCQACGTSNKSTELVLRVQGWRIWSGTTIGGSDSSVVYCPACCGEAGVDDGGESTGWTALCQTCLSSIADEWDDEGPFTEADVKAFQDEHQCETDIEITPPKRAAVSA